MRPDRRDAGRAIEAHLIAALDLADEVGCAETLRAGLRDAESRFVPTEPMAWRGGAPERGAVTVLLTNRVHPSRDFNALRELRGPVHDALFELADRA
jgi:hypothetical protein